MKFTYSLILLLLLSIASYGKDAKKMNGTENVILEKITKSGIYDTKMILTRLNGKAVNSTDFYIIINSSNNVISGKSGCNNFSVNYKNLKKTNQIETSLPRGTMMACEEEKMNLEQEFISEMNNKKLKAVQKKNTVIFKDAHNKTVMEFAILAQNDIWSFIGKNKWKLIQLENIGKDFGKVSIEFDTADKKVSGNTGCNSFFGTYQTDSNFIEFSKIGNTRMACIDDETSKTEQKILAFLNNKKITFDVADQTLNFYLDDRLVMMFGKI